MRFFKYVDLCCTLNHLSVHAFAMICISYWKIPVTELDSQADGGLYKFSKMMLFIRKLELLLKWQAYLVQFLENVSKYYTLINCNFPIIPWFQRFPWKKWIFNLTSQSQKLFFLRHLLYFMMQQQCFVSSSHFAKPNTKKVWTRGLRFNKINIFNFLSKDIFQCNCFFVVVDLHCQSVVPKSTVIPT